MGSDQEAPRNGHVPGDETSDGSLVRRVQEGDREALELLARRYLRPVHAVAASFLRERVDVEDAAQEAFLRAMESIRRFDPSRPFAPWLYQIVRNVARNRLKWRKRHPVAPVADAEGVLVDPSASPAVGAERGQLRERVAAAVDELPEQRRMAFRLVDVEGYSATEAGHLMGLTPGAVRAHVFHARRDLRVRLAPFAEGDERGGSR